MRHSTIRVLMLGLLVQFSACSKQDTFQHGSENLSLEQPNPICLKPNNLVMETPEVSDEPVISEPSKEDEQRVITMLREYVRLHVGAAFGDANYEENLDFNRSGTISGLDRTYMLAFPNHSSSQQIAHDLDDLFTIKRADQSDIELLDVNQDGALTDTDKNLLNAVLTLMMSRIGS